MSTTKKMAWFLWLIASIFYAYQYILRVMPNIMLPEIMQQFGIEAAVYGQFSGAYYIGYCAMHLPIGIMLDRFGPKRIMSICILLTVVGSLPIIFATHWIYPIIGRFLIGVGSSAAILGAFKIIRMTFNEQHFTRMLSLAVTIGLLGAIYGGGPVSYLSGEYGHKTVIEIFAVLGVLFAAITYCIVPKIESSHNTTVIADLRTVFTNKKVMLICALAGMMVGPMEGFADAWGSEFLKQVYGFNAATSNSLTSLIYIGMCFGPVLSRIAEKTGYYLETIAGAGIVMGVLFTILVTGSLDKNGIILSFFLVGVCCAYQILAIYKASTYVAENVAGLTTAVTNMIIMSFGYVFHSLIGIVIQTNGAINQAKAFAHGITVIPISLAIGAFGFIMISYQERSAGKRKLEITK